MYATIQAESGGRENVINSEGKYEGVSQIQQRTWAHVHRNDNEAYSIDPRAQIKTQAMLYAEIQSNLGTKDPRLLYLGYARGEGTARTAQTYMSQGMSLAEAMQRSILDAVRRGARGGIAQSRDPRNRTSGMSTAEFEAFQVQSFFNALKKVNGANLEYNEGGSDDEVPSSSDKQFFDNIGTCNDAVQAIKNNPVILTNIVKAFNKKKHPVTRWIPFNGVV